ncbi:MAG: winged helix-turn-helix transcriptional regulator [Telluria sp.]
MKEVDVKQAITVLYKDGKMTQTEIAAELNCTQANVHYHLNNTAATSRAPARLVERIKATFEQRGLTIPMCVVPTGAM